MLTPNDMTLDTRFASIASENVFSASISVPIITTSTSSMNSYPLPAVANRTYDSTIKSSLSGTEEIGAYTEQAGADYLIQYLINPKADGSYELLVNALSLTGGSVAIPAHDVVVSFSETNVLI